MTRVNDLSRCLAVLDQDSTLIAVIELSLKSWLVAAIVPGLARRPLKKLDADPDEVLRLLERWREEAAKAGRPITRIAVAFEAGRDGFWLARWLRARGIEAHVIHSTSVAVPREHRRAKTDRLDTELLMRGFLGWLRGEPKHCQMAAIPTLDEEDARRPGRERDVLVRECTRIANRMKATLIRLGIRGFNPKLRRAARRLEGLRTPEGAALPANTLGELRRAMARLALLRDQIKEVEDQRLARLTAAARAPRPADAAPAETCPGERARMVFQLAWIVGLGIETGDLLVHEVFCRNLRDRRAVARYGGLTGAPDESGTRRREKGLARAGNARVRKAMIQLAWRFLIFQKDSALAQWYRAQNLTAKGPRKTMIVALARKLLIALWRYATTGVPPEGIVLRQPV